MTSGAVTGYLDVAQLVLYMFWLFFAGLIIYLRREDKREGYPLESDRSARVRVQGFPGLPAAKSFHLAEGGLVLAPRVEQDLRPLHATPTAGHLGAPLAPTGNPMRDGVGPAAYADRAPHPDLLIDGTPMIVPLRVAGGFSVAQEDLDPRGLPVIGADGVAGGTVSELWVDRAEPQIRYLEVQTGMRSVLLPMTFAKIDSRRRRIHVNAINGAQFADVPGLVDANSVTRREEDRISAYYAGGTLYANPQRAEPFL